MLLSFQCFLRFEYLCLSASADPLTGLLDDIFNKAYSVTVTIDSEMLRGALFRFPSLGEDKKSGI